jgi:hypothetical protein
MYTELYTNLVEHIISSIILGLYYRTDTNLRYAAVSYTNLVNYNNALLFYVADEDDMYSYYFLYYPTNS